VEEKESSSLSWLEALLLGRSYCILVSTQRATAHKWAAVVFNVFNIVLIRLKNNMASRRCSWQSCSVTALYRHRTTTIGMQSQDGRISYVTWCSYKESRMSLTRVTGQGVKTPWYFVGPPFLSECLACEIGAWLSYGTWHHAVCSINGSVLEGLVVWGVLFNDAANRADYAEFVIG